MTKSLLLAALAAISLSVVAAQGIVPLADKRFTYDNIPYRVDTDVGQPRGEQKGYNICNSTTEGPSSLCQTAFINSLDDFCLWAPAEPGHTVGDIEGEMIAWCTKPGHGTRVIPDGTILGVQFTKSPDYVQVVGFMDQTKINMIAGDAGGEMDPHGADRRGNPMGGLLFTNAWTGGMIQAVEWHNFNGANIFCLKACDPRGPRAPQMCEHIYDTQGCGFNAPSNVRNGTFESCASDSQSPPGQGPPVAPASSQCSTYESTAIYGASASVTVQIPGAATMSFTPTKGAPTTTSRPTSAASSSPGAGTSAGASGSTSSGGPAATQTGASRREEVARFGIIGAVAVLLAFAI
ncbi:unnamed protein product [Cyclocybe aegerita]|uniref:Macrofage activating glycoprotein n=1 Tax=Cyclocybe aegerita TaxID=1973307 RepID=A0A8S0X333_CYCAE|nr:unnamed protein product [Cyclocybe aegerita]